MTNEERYIRCENCEKIIDLLRDFSIYISNKYDYEKQGSWVMGFCSYKCFDKWRLYDG